MIVGSSLSAVPVIARAGFQTWPGKDYVWNGLTFISGYEGGNLEISFLAGLFGSLANAHTGITNMRLHSGAVNHVLDRASDPGAGAISPVVEYNFRSIYPIKAGEELFVSYGESWYVCMWVQFCFLPPAQCTHSLPT
jgi:hypothetical protein